MWFVCRVSRRNEPSFVKQLTPSALSYNDQFGIAIGQSEDFNGLHGIAGRGRGKRKEKALESKANKQNMTCKTRERRVKHWKVEKGAAANSESTHNMRDNFLSVTDACALPKLVGPCRAAMPRWYFNSRVQRCERFTFGGCLGNANNFRSKQSCQNQCICSLPKAPGPCRGYFPSWFYNTETGRCEEFNYGGCIGNMNRFYHKKGCERVCAGAQGMLIVRAYLVKKIGEIPPLNNIYRQRILAYFLQDVFGRFMKFPKEFLSF